MIGSAAQQTALVRAHAGYVTARALRRVMPSMARQIAEDRAHGDMLLAAMRMGYDPAGIHRHVSAEDWAGRRVRLIQAILPNHCREAGSCR